MNLGTPYRRPHKGKSLTVLYTGNVGPEPIDLIEQAAGAHRDLTEFLRFRDTSVFRP